MANGKLNSVQYDEAAQSLMLQLLISDFGDDFTAESTANFQMDLHNKLVEQGLIEQNAEFTFTIDVDRINNTFTLTIPDVTPDELAAAFPNLMDAYNGGENLTIIGPDNTDITDLILNGETQPELDSGIIGPPPPPKIDLGALDPNALDLNEGAQVDAEELVVEDGFAMSIDVSDPNADGQVGININMTETIDGVAQTPVTLSLGSHGGGDNALSFNEDGQLISDRGGDMTLTVTANGKTAEVTIDVGQLHAEGAEGVGLTKDQIVSAIEKSLAEQEISIQDLVEQTVNEDKPENTTGYINITERIAAREEIEPLTNEDKMNFMQATLIAQDVAANETSGFLNRGQKGDDAEYNPGGAQAQALLDAYAKKNSIDPADTDALWAAMLEDLDAGSEGFDQDFRDNYEAGIDKIQQLRGGDEQNRAHMGKTDYATTRVEQIILNTEGYDGDYDHHHDGSDAISLVRNDGDFGYQTNQAYQAREDLQAQAQADAQWKPKEPLGASAFGGGAEPISQPQPGGPQELVAAVGIDLRHEFERACNADYKARLGMDHGGAWYNKENDRMAGKTIQRALGGLEKLMEDGSAEELEIIAAVDGKITNAEFGDYFNKLDAVENIDLSNLTDANNNGVLDAADFSIDPEIKGDGDLGLNEGTQFDRDGDGYDDRFEAMVAHLKEEGVDFTFTAEKDNQSITIKMGEGGELTKRFNQNGSITTNDLTAAAEQALEEVRLAKNGDAGLQDKTLSELEEAGYGKGSSGAIVPNDGP